ncbi:MAG: hypothetical protein IKD40_01620 [Bacteroidaceae bacterium]|nr:hypothetical protein [Bacteroidaceae bacterium]
MGSGRSLIVSLVAISAVLLISLLGSIMFIYLFPQYGCKEHWIVPTLFILFYFITFYFVLPPDIGSKQAIKNMMLFRLMKLMLLPLSIIIAAFVFRESAKELLVAFLAYYLLMIIPETLYILYLKKCSGNK